MRNPDEFDAFYKDARDRLLLQTYALTGDLPASRAAVRDSFVVAWHHWRKISRMDDPEAWARPHAWSHAQRRHTARLWHRDKNLDPEIRATLDALGKLSVPQRKTLLLSQLASVSMEEMAREVGLPRRDAERELQTATAQFAVHRDVPSTHIRALFEALRDHVGDGRWPRASILRRAGAARRRTHTAVGAIGAVAALVVTGVLVTDVAGVRPTLSRDEPGAASAARQSDGARPAPRPEPTPEALPESSLLSSAQVGLELAGPGWQVDKTTDNADGSDTVTLPCQQDPYADPRGTAALVRSFSSRADSAAKAAAYQAAEVSGSAKAAGRAYDRARSWFGGCTDSRVQLVATYQVDGVGDDATMVVLRSWDKGSTMVAAVARTGRVTTTALVDTPGTGGPPVPRATRLFAAAVDSLCHLRDGDTCSTKPRLSPTTPLPVGQVPGMLSEIDLPPVNGVQRPWVGTEPRKAMTNVAATGCDKADFTASGISNNLTRSFLIPEAGLPDQFGLTETVGSMPAARAHAFVEEVRSRMKACPDKDLGSKVAQLANESTKDTDLSVWRVTTEISDESSLQFLMGIVRHGTSVAQVGFVPTGSATMAADDFPTLVRRAQDRLPALPPPAPGG
jgi:DNA-directed RNA polymerase specialized sigma24 family protein